MRVSMRSSGHLSESDAVMKRSVLAVAVLAGVISACGGGPFGFQGYRELLAAEARWSRLGWSDYIFEMRSLCFCSGEQGQWSRVEVLADTVSAVHLLTSQMDVPTWRLTEWPTVSQLLERIRLADGPYERIVATYDPDLGYPTSVDFIPGKGVFDAGLRMELRALVTRSLAGTREEVQR
jgi:hypothetical protein